MNACSDYAQEWIAVSRSKSDRLYHIERIDAWDSYEGPEFEVTESSATKTYPSDLIDQIAADHNEFRETDGVPPFINARYAAQLEHMREVYPLKQNTPEKTPGTAALKDGLAKLRRRLNLKRHPATTSDRAISLIKSDSRGPHEGPLASAKPSLRHCGSQQESTVN